MYHVLYDPWTVKHHSEHNIVPGADVWITPDLGRVTRLCGWPNGGGAQVQSATETSTNNLAKLSLEELMAIEVDTVYGASKHEQNYHDPASADFTQDSIQQDGRQFRIKATYKF